MKAKIIQFAIFLVSFAFLPLSCDETVYKVYKGNIPVYMSYEELRSGVVTDETAQLENPGKIYFKDNYIFIVEDKKGIHIFDNADPSSPVKKSFVKIPGVVDISITGHFLYADSYIDMVVLDVQDINNINLAARVKDILPYVVPPVDNEYGSARPDKSKGVVIDWVVGTIKERDYEYWEPYPVYKKDILTYTNGVSRGISGNGIGTGGSMARFGIKDNFLYILAQSDIRIFDITTKTNPQAAGSTYSLWNAETMFLTEKYLFIGASTGMMIYDITSPGNPVEKTFFMHARSCDPVIVDDTLAYITLRSGTICGGSINVLSVVNIKDINSPVEVMEYNMTNPHGLGKDGDLLFICDGTAGLKIFDASDPRTITSHLVREYSDIHAYDVIPVNGLLILIGDDGMYQYDYTDIQDISLISSIVVD